MIFLFQMPVTTTLERLYSTMPWRDGHAVKNAVQTSQSFWTSQYVELI